MSCCLCSFELDIYLKFFECESDPADQIISISHYIIYLMKLYRLHPLVSKDKIDLFVKNGLILVNAMLTSQKKQSMEMDANANDLLSVLIK